MFVLGLILEEVLVVWFVFIRDLIILIRGEVE